MRILVADDDPLQREILGAQLAAWGHEAVAAADGAAAWTALEAPGGPRLALVDWMMPPPDGAELCRRLRARPDGGGDVYVIMVTSRSGSEHLAAGLEAGADDFVAKPVDPLELRARLGAGLRIVELRQRLLDSERQRVLGQTAGAAAHEIRQPLALIQATVQLCQRDPALDERRARRYESLLQAVKRIDDIIERMAAVDRYRTRDYGDADIVDFGD